MMLSFCYGWWVCRSYSATTVAWSSKRSTRWEVKSVSLPRKRYYAHLPAAISLIDENAKGGGMASYSQPSRGHCETISKFGMRLSLVGTRFTEAELSQPGRLLFVRVDLPEGPIEAVVSIVSSERGGEATKKRWTLGAKIQQMSDADRERLTSYLAKRAKDEPVVISD
jgi:hypothetical protein